MIVISTIIGEACGHRYKAGEWEAGWLDEYQKQKPYLLFALFP
jgi:hypothetical protein